MAAGDTAFNCPADLYDISAGGTAVSGGVFLGIAFSAIFVSIVPHLEPLGRMNRGAHVWRFRDLGMDALIEVILGDKGAPLTTLVYGPGRVANTTDAVGVGTVNLGTTRPTRKIAVRPANSAHPYFQISEAVVLEAGTIQWTPEPGQKHQQARRITIGTTWDTSTNPWLEGDASAW